MIEKYGTVKMEDWRKDHWSMLAYIECRCVDFKGKLDYKHVRCNDEVHFVLLPENVNNLGVRYRKTEWHDRYSTRIRGSEQIRGHDDWDCVEDLQAAGLVKIVSMVDLQIEMTGLGWEMINLLRQHKAAGGIFSTFRASISEFPLKSSGFNCTVLSRDSICQFKFMVI